MANHQPSRFDRMVEWALSDWFGLRIWLCIIWCIVKHMKGSKVPAPVRFAGIVFKCIVLGVAVATFNWVWSMIRTSGLYVYNSLKKGFATRRNFLWECAAVGLGIWLMEVDRALALWVASDAATSEPAVQTQLYVYSKRVSTSFISASSSTRKTSIERRDSSCDGYSSDTESGYAGSVPSSPERLRGLLVEKSPIESSARFGSFGSLMDLATSDYSSGDDSDVSSIAAEYGSDAE